MNFGFFCFFVFASGGINVPPTTYNIVGLLVGFEAGLGPRA